jgi:hypothetical protein
VKSPKRQRPADTRRNPIARAPRIVRPKVKPSGKVYDRRRLSLVSDPV